MLARRDYRMWIKPGFLSSDLIFIKTYFAECNLRGKYSGIRDYKTVLNRRSRTFLLKRRKKKGINLQVQLVLENRQTRDGINSRKTCGNLNYIHFALLCFALGHSDTRN